MVLDTSAVPQRLAIEDGPTVHIDGWPAQGTQHEIMFGVIADSGERVVVKIERVVGALDRERTALAWLAAAPGVAPTLLAGGSATLDGERVRCLITERCPGSPPKTLDSWKRMGGALGRLAELGRPDRLLPTLPPAEFVNRHTTRLRELGPRLHPFVASIPDWESLTKRTLPASTPMVLTHGDPGPGNYLDTGSTGKLIDWEQAQISPIGLDFARSMFIALLGSGPAGYQATDHQARCRAAARGYLHAVASHWRPTPEDVRWWLSVAAIQFIHRRWQSGGRPAPWEQAATVLQTSLNSHHSAYA